VTSILAIYIGQLWKRIIEVYGEEGMMMSDDDGTDDE
jgi:hypothetical protein